MFLNVPSPSPRYVCALLEIYTATSCVSKASPPMETRRLRAATVSKSFKVERPGESKNRPFSARSPFSLDYILASSLRHKVVSQADILFFGKKRFRLTCRKNCSRFARERVYNSLLKFLLTGVQLFIARGVRHWIVAGTVFCGDCLKRLG